MALSKDSFSPALLKYDPNMPFQFVKYGVWYVIYNQTFSVWHTRSKHAARRVVTESNGCGRLMLPADVYGPNTFPKNTIGSHR